MRAVKQRDNPRELTVRSLLHRKGFRFRVHRRVIEDLRRYPDIVFVRARVAVFLDGCFWHSCPRHGTSPKANHRWWRAKLKQNVARDRDMDVRLRAAGWKPVRIWEHSDPIDAADRISKVVQERVVRLSR